MAISDRPVSRRTLLLAGGGTVVTATATGVVLGRREQQAPSPPGAVGPFDIDAAAELLRPTPLHNITGPQSIAFDEHGRLYALQVMQGGVRLPDEERTMSGKARRLAGDMCVTAYNRAGSAARHMYLRGFGHGISMGVEPSGDGPLLWVETMPTPVPGTDVPWPASPSATARCWTARHPRYATTGPCPAAIGSIRPWTWPAIASC
ncbi:hypothetical protein ACFVY7_14915 [[Kitasatospora] papulosa]|uniref:hypothetical protein n=1 Tax=[Kitasatospora] papulosa TaxID=1464011 RepID=UPI0036B9EB69